MDRVFFYYTQVMSNINKNSKKMDDKKEGNWKKVGKNQFSVCIYNTVIISAQIKGVTMTCILSFHFGL